MSKKNRNNKRKKSINKAQAQKRRRAVLSCFRAFAVILLAGGLIAGIAYINKSVEIPLSVNAENYYQIANEEPESTEVLEEIEAISANADLSKYKVAQPKLQSTYPIDMAIRSEYAIVYDVQADEVLFAKNADQKCYPASTTKIMTAAVVLDNVPEDFQFIAGDELDFVNPESSLAHINKGNILDLPTTIDALMLPSGNDASYMAAANVGRLIAGEETISPQAAVQTFVDEMNKTAALLGAESTHFSDPDGFHDDNHYTTVLDMLKITLYAMKNSKLMESVVKPNTYATYVSGEQISWENSNKLLHEYSDCYYMYANGMKTGMTDQAGYCVVATAKRFDHDVVCVVFGAEASDIRWNDTIALLDAAYVQIRNREGI